MHFLTRYPSRRIALMIALLATSRGQARAQSASLSTEFEIVQDALGRSKGRVPGLRVDEQSSRAAIGQLQIAMGVSPRAQSGRLFHDLTVEPSDSVVRCASRADRGASWCGSVSPRNVLLLYGATRSGDSSVVLSVQAIRWERPGATHPPSSVWRFQYRRSQTGVWTFDRELSGVAS